MKKIKFIFILILLFLPLQSHAVKGYNTRELFAKQFNLSEDLPAAIIIMGMSKHKKGFDALLDSTAKEAKRLYDDLDGNNPNSDIYKINHANERQVKVNQTVLDFTRTAIDLVKLTKGEFDPFLYKNKGVGKRIKIDSSNSTIILPHKGTKFLFGPIIPGYIADYITSYIQDEGENNVLIKVGGVFKGIGRSVNGPWKIQVQDDMHTFAKRAMKITVDNIGVATMNSKFYEAAHKSSLKNPKCKGTTVIASNATRAGTLAYAAYVWGPEKGRMMLEKLGYKGMIVDNDGKFVRTKGF